MINKILNKIFDIINYKRIEYIKDIIKKVMINNLKFSDTNMDIEDQRYALSIRQIYEIIYNVSKTLYEENINKNGKS
jgi:hypothetical protein